MKELKTKKKRKRKTVNKIMKMTRKQRQIKENTASINTMLCCNGNCVQAIRSLKLWVLYCCWQKSHRRSPTDFRI